MTTMQLSFGDAEHTGKRKKTRREVFLAEMEQVVPWNALLKLIEPHYPKMGRPGRQPYPLSTMLRVHFLQQWYALSDPAMEEALYDTAVLRRFARLSGLDTIPDETTILNFRRLLETHELAPQLLERVNAHLARGPEPACGYDRGRHDHRGALVDEERFWPAGSGDASDQEGQPVVLRDEGPCRGRCRDRVCALGAVHRG